MTDVPRTSLVALGIALTLAVTSAPAAADWPVYGHDILNSRNGGADGPTKAEAANLKQKWRFASPTGDFTGTPVIANGILVAGDYSGTVYALDAATGKVRWRKNLGGPINASAAIDIRAPKLPTVYVPVAKEGAPRVVALSLSSGALRWSKVLTNQPTSSVYGSPTFWDNRVYIGTSGPNGDNSTARGSVVALDQDTGDVAWRTYMVPKGRDGGPVWSTPAIDVNSGTLYVGTGNAYHMPAAPMTDSIVSIDTVTGDVIRHYQAVAGDVFPTNPLGADADFGASPNIVDAPGGQQLVGEGNKNGNYYAVDRGTMKFAWKTSIGPGSAVGGVVGSTAYDGRRIFGTNASTGQVAALNRDGGVAWQSADGGSTDFSPVAAANGVVYTMNPSGLITMRDANTGTILGTLSVGGPSFGGIATSGRAVFAAQGVGPPPPPAPQQDGKGAIVAFGEPAGPGGGGGGGPGGSKPKSKCRSPGGARMRLSVRPRRARAHRRVKFRFRATCRGRAVRGARVSFARKHRRTNRRGRTTITVRFGKTGKKVARVKKHGLRSGRATVRVRR